MKRIIKLKQRNPLTLDYILKHSNSHSLISKSKFYSVYKISFDADINLKIIKLKAGTYIYKIKNLIGSKFDEYDKNYLYFLSDNDLIPKIYVIGNNYILMKYVSFPTLSKKLKEHLTLSDKKQIYNNLLQLINIWHDFEVGHGDLHLDNILVSKNNLVYLIDPLQSFLGSKTDYEIEVHKHNIIQDSKDLRNIKKSIFVY